MSRGKMGLCMVTTKENYLAKISESRPVVAGSTIAEVYSASKAHLWGKMNKHGDGAYASNHEALGVIAEEYDEFIEAVRSNNRQRIEEELYDLATAALFAVASSRTHKESAGL